MQSVSGYLTIDGNFFNTEVEARLHEAETNIRVYCVTHTSEGKLIPEGTMGEDVPLCIDAEKLIPIIEALADPIMEYLNARQEASASLPKVNEERAKDTKAPETREHQTDREKAPQPPPL